jgi:hypothetical protein
MKAIMPVLTVIDRKGNILREEYEERALTEGQKKAICKLLLSAIEGREEIA